MNIIPATIMVDLSMMAFEEAVGKVRAKLPVSATLYCGYKNTCLADQIKQKYSCAIILVPDELLMTIYAWAVGYENSLYYSVPTA